MPISLRILCWQRAVQICCTFRQRTVNTALVMRSKWTRPSVQKPSTPESVQVHSTGLVKPDDPRCQNQVPCCGKAGLRDGRDVEEQPTFRLALNTSDEIAWHCKPWHCNRLWPHLPQLPGETLLEEVELRSTPIRQGQKKLCLYSMRGWTEYFAAVRLHLCVEMLVDSLSSKDVRNQQSAQHPSRANR